VAATRPRGTGPPALQDALDTLWDVPGRSGSKASLKRRGTCVEVPLPGRPNPRLASGPHRGWGDGIGTDPREPALYRVPPQSLWPGGPRGPGPPPSPHETERAASRTKGTFLAARYSRIARRRGPNKAAVAIAHTIFISAWHMATPAKPTSTLEPTSVGAEYSVVAGQAAFRYSLTRPSQRVDFSTGSGWLCCCSTPLAGGCWSSERWGRCWL